MSRYPLSSSFRQALQDPQEGAELLTLEIESVLHEAREEGRRGGLEETHDAVHIVLEVAHERDVRRAVVQPFSSSGDQRQGLQLDPVKTSPVPCRVDVRLGRSSFNNVLG